jgi:hypothetical protein
VFELLVVSNLNRHRQAYSTRRRFHHWHIFHVLF